MPARGYGAARGHAAPLNRRWMSGAARRASPAAGRTQPLFSREARLSRPSRRDTGGDRRLQPCPAAPAAGPARPRAPFEPARASGKEPQPLPAGGAGRGCPGRAVREPLRFPPRGSGINPWLAPLPSPPPPPAGRAPRARRSLLLPRPGRRRAGAGAGQERGERPGTAGQRCAQPHLPVFSWS